MAGRLNSSDPIVARIVAYGVVAWFGLIALFGLGLAFQKYSPYIADFSHGSPESEQFLTNARIVCRQIAECAAYGEATVACATAGDISRCVEIKLGGRTVTPYQCRVGPPAGSLAGSHCLLFEFVRRVVSVLPRLPAACA
jgi:hypothetical protein